MAEEERYGLHRRLADRFGERMGDALFSFVAVLAGALSLALFGLLDNPSVLAEGVSLARVGAATLSTALTGAVLLLLRASHPPAGATVLIVSLGLLKTPVELTLIMAGVVLVTGVGWAINRAAGVPALSGRPGPECTFSSDGRMVIDIVDRQGGSDHGQGPRAERQGRRAIREAA